MQRIVAHIMLVIAITMQACSTAPSAGSRYRTSAQGVQTQIESARSALDGPKFGFVYSQDTFRVFESSAHATAQGLRVGDRIVKVSGLGTVVTSPSDFPPLSERLRREGAAVELTVERDGKQRVITLTPSAEQWVSEFYTAVQSQKWQAALITLDRAASERSALTNLMYQAMRYRLIGIEEERVTGNLGWQGLYARNKFLATVFDQGEANPRIVDDTRAFVIETIEFARYLGARVVAEDLQTRLTSHDRRRSELATREKIKSPEAIPPPTTATGTGFFVTSDGWVLTAFHVVEGASKITVQAGSASWSARVVRTQPAIDLALLEVDVASPEFLPIPAELACQSGDYVFTIGFPVTAVLGEEPKFSDGAISGLSGISGDASIMQITVPIQPGNSGGALVNARGEAVGIVVSSAAPAAFLRASGALPQNVNFAVRSDLVRPLLRDRARNDPQACESRECAISRAKRATVFVIAEP